MNALFDHLLEKGGEGLGFGKGVEFALEFADGSVGLSFGVGFEELDFEDEAGDVIEGFVVDRDTREWFAGVLVDEFGDGGFGGEGKDDGAGGGGVFGESVAEAEEVFDDAAFGGFDGSLFLADVGHGEVFGAAEGAFLFAAGHAAGDFFGDPNEG